jgi:hypothetical protein
VERAPSRFFILPLLALIVIGVVRLQSLLFHASYGLTLRLLSILGTAHTAFLLSLHFANWRIESMEASFAEKKVVLNAALAAGNDAFYEAVVKGSIGVSLLAVVLWVWLYKRARKRMESSSSS